jgi:aldose 1-epimerase
MKITKRNFGTTSGGEPATLFTCTNTNGLVVKLTDFGALVVSVETPDRVGKLDNITLGFAKLSGYEQRHPYYGATVGRYCNRIANGSFFLNGSNYVLAKNDGDHHLHGGTEGFDRRFWQAEGVLNDEGVGVRFTRRSPDGEEGYPGNLDVSVIYLLTDDDQLQVEFTATTDQPTPVNLTNHSYWNLAGAGAGKILNHFLRLAADKYLCVNDELIPTGEMAAVKDTPLDFIELTEIGAGIKHIASDTAGYDHCYVLNSQDGSMAFAARVSDPASGRVLEIHTTQPGIQFYTGNFLGGGRSDGEFGQHEGFCLETQHYPDSPNQSEFPSTVLQPGEKFRQLTAHRFLVEA